MTANTTGPLYRIYLLTVWQVQEQSESGEPVWRFHLTDPQTGKRFGFAGVDALLTALQQTMHHSSTNDEGQEQRPL